MSALLIIAAALLACIVVVLAAALAAAAWADRAIERERARHEHDCDGLGSAYNPRLRHPEKP